MRSLRERTVENGVSSDQALARFSRMTEAEKEALYQQIAQAKPWRDAIWNLFAFVSTYPTTIFFIMFSLALRSGFLFTIVLACASLVLDKRLVAQSNVWALNEVEHVRKICNGEIILTGFSKRSLLWLLPGLLTAFVPLIIIPVLERTQLIMPDWFEQAMMQLASVLISVCAFLLFRFPPGEYYPPIRDPSLRRPPIFPSQNFDVKLFIDGHYDRINTLPHGKIFNLSFVTAMAFIIFLTSFIGIYNIELNRVLFTFSFFAICSSVIFYIMLFCFLWRAKSIANCLINFKLLAPASEVRGVNYE